MEPTLVVIGISYKTAALAVRERFWMPVARQVEALRHLVRSEGIDEVAVISTCNRTEFYLWTGNPSDASNSVLRFLTHSYDLKLSDWSNFYRLVDDAAVSHVFRVTAGLDTRVFGEPDVIDAIVRAWRLAQRADTTGRFLDSILKRAVKCALRIQSELPDAPDVVPVSVAAVRQCKAAMEDLAGRSALVIGAGQMAEAVCLQLIDAGVKNIVLSSRTHEKAEDLAARIGAKAVPLDESAPELPKAGILVAATTAERAVISREQVETALGISKKPMVILDVGVPRNVQSSVRTLPGVTLFDIDDLCENTQPSVEVRISTKQAEHAVRQESSGLLRALLSENVIPTIANLRQQLEQMAEQELTTVSDHMGPLTADQSELLRAYASHVTQRIAATVARNLNVVSGVASTDQLNRTVELLFDLKHERSTYQLAKES